MQYSSNEVSGIFSNKLLTVRSGKRWPVMAIGVLGTALTRGVDAAITVAVAVAYSFPLCELIKLAGAFALNNAGLMHAILVLFNVYVCLIISSKKKQKLH